MSEVPLVTPNNTSGRGRANNLISSDIVGGGRTTRRSLILLVMFGLLALLGLLFVARRNMSGALDNSTPLSQGTNHGSGSYSESILNMGNNPAYTEFLVKEDYKGGRLNEAQLKDLVGMYYAKAPQTSELQALYKAGERIITRDQLPEKTRIIPPGSMVTMDWVEDRLNIHLDNTEHIKKVKYG